MKTKFYALLMVLLLVCISYISHAQANTSLSNLTSPTAINQDLLPNGNNIRNLGSAQNSWKILYVDSSIYLKDSLFINNTGTQNTLVGQRAGYSITTGMNNAAYGFHALYNNVTGGYNSAFGSYALVNNTAYDNTAFGYRALNHNTTGTGNTAIGKLALYENTTGDYNIANGWQSLYNNTTANYNVATGYQALFYTTEAGYNVAIGYQSLYSNVAGDNTAVGEKSLMSNTTGSGNTADGDFALMSNTTGGDNTAIGDMALSTNRFGFYNTALGSNANVSSYFSTNATAIGSNAYVDANNKVRVGNTNVSSIGGQVGWTSFSDGRYKKNIKQDVQGLAFINSLQPITYTVDIDGLDAYYEKERKHDSNYNKMKIDMKESADKASKIIYNGFIAQDVEKAAAKLNYNFSGVDKPQSKDGLYGLRYADFVVPLVKAVQELSKQNDTLKIKNDELEARLSKLETMMNVSSQSTSVSSASLAQNVPNPFANSTSISYNLPQSYTSAKIIITDKRGVVLKETSLSASGKGNLNVDASTLVAGAYQYSLYVNNKLVDTKQMVLSR